MESYPPTKALKGHILPRQLQRLSGQLEKKDDYVCKQNNEAERKNVYLPIFFFRDTATKIAPFPQSFFASPTPKTESPRLKKEIEVSNYPKSFTNLGRQPSTNNDYARPKISFEQVNKVTKW